MSERDMMDIARERAEEASQYPLATFHRIGQVPIEGYFDPDGWVFTSKAGFEYFAEVHDTRWNGDKYLVWGTEGLLGEVRMETVGEMEETA